MRAYKLEAGKTQENEQPVVPVDGTITVQIKGENPNVTEIEIQQLESRYKKMKIKLSIGKIKLGRVCCNVK